jgi:hypothetical protein
MMREQKEVTGINHIKRIVVDYSSPKGVLEKNLVWARPESSKKKLTTSNTLT